VVEWPKELPPQQVIEVFANVFEALFCGELARGFMDAAIEYGNKIGQPQVGQALSQSLLQEVVADFEPCVDPTEVFIPREHKE